QTTDGIDAAGGKEDDPGPVRAGKLEAVQGSAEVGVQQITCAPSIAGLYRRLGGAFDQHVDSFRKLELFAVPHVAVDEAYAVRREPGQGEFRAATFQVVQGRDAILGVVPLPREAEVRAHESGSSRDQDVPHGRLRVRNGLTTLFSWNSPGS